LPLRELLRTHVRSAKSVRIATAARKADVCRRQRENRMVHSLSMPALADSPSACQTGTMKIPNKSADLNSLHEIFQTKWRILGDDHISLRVTIWRGCHFL